MAGSQLKHVFSCSKYHELEANFFKIQSKYMILLQESQAPRMGESAAVCGCMAWVCTVVALLGCLKLSGVLTSWLEGIRHKIGTLSAS